MSCDPPAWADRRSEAEPGGAASLDCPRSPALDLRVSKIMQHLVSVELAFGKRLRSRPGGAPLRPAAGGTARTSARGRRSKTARRVPEAATWYVETTPRRAIVSVERRRA